MQACFLGFLLCKVEAAATLAGQLASRGFEDIVVKMADVCFNLS
jgi:hypothetical protein